MIRAVWTRLCAGVSLIGRRGEEAAVTQAAIDVQEHALPAPAWGGL